MNKWTGKDLDQFMDMVLDGKSPKALAEHYGWTVEEVGEQFREAFYPSEPYRPWGRRKDRSGLPMTSVEQQIIAKHQASGIPAAHTARMLQRRPDEINNDYWGVIKFNQLKCLAPVQDQLLAHHYLFHISKHPIIKNSEYDAARKSQKISELKKIRRGVEDYPHHIRALANYMLFKFMEATGEWNSRWLPYSWRHDVPDNKVEQMELLND